MNTVASVATSNHAAGVAFVVAFIIAAAIAAIYVAMFAFRNKKFAATGNIGYLVVEIVALCGIAKTLYKIFTLEYVDTMGVDEQFCIGLGGLLTAVILLKKIIKIWSGIYSYTGTADPETDDD